MKKLKILLVEDTPDVLESLLELLEMEGYEMAGATNGKAALEKLQTFTPHLIITDLRMPEMDGFTFLRNVKSNPVHNTIPVLVFSANATPENEDKSLHLGAAGFLKKPCNTDRLLEHIQTLLHHR
jgi:CheY-like chemotaxis protein